MTKIYNIIRLIPFLITAIKQLINLYFFIKKKVTDARNNKRRINCRKRDDDIPEQEYKK